MKKTVLQSGWNGLNKYGIDIGQKSEDFFALYVIKKKQVSESYI